MKTCIVENCINPVFAKALCRNHQWKRTDKKPKKPAFKRSEPKMASIPTFGFDDQQSMFTALWDNAKKENGDVICDYTGKKLNQFYDTDLWFSCFMHVLPKGQYTYWKLNPDNIRIALPEFHRIVDQGTLDDRMQHLDWRFDIFDTEKELLKLQYKYWKTKNLLR